MHWICSKPSFTRTRFVFVFPFLWRYALKCTGRKAPRGWANFSAATNQPWQEEATVNGYGLSMRRGQGWKCMPCIIQSQQKAATTDCCETQNLHSLACSGNIFLMDSCSLAVCICLFACLSSLSVNAIPWLVLWPIHLASCLCVCIHKWQMLL